MPRRAELPNLTPARLDITHYRGDSITMRLRMRSQGVPVNVVGWDMEAHVRATPDGPVLADFTVIPDQTILDPETGKPAVDPVTGEPQSFWQQGIVRLYMGEISAQMLPSTSSWDFQVRETVGEGALAYQHTRTLVRGFIYAPADITHRNVTPVATRRR